MEYLIENMQGVLILLQWLSWMITILSIIFYFIDAVEELYGLEKYIETNPIKTIIVVLLFVVSTLLSCVYLFFYYKN